MIALKKTPFSWERLWEDTDKITSSGVRQFSVIFPDEFIFKAYYVNDACMLDLNDEYVREFILFKENGELFNTISNVGDVLGIYLQTGHYVNDGEYENIITPTLPQLKSSNQVYKFNTDLLRDFVFFATKEKAAAYKCEKYIKFIKSEQYGRIRNILIDRKPEKFC